MGFIYGIFLYKKPVNVKRILLVEAVVMILCNLILTPFWLNMLYGTSLIALPRIIRNVILYPVNTALIYFVLKAVRDFKKITV